MDSKTRDQWLAWRDAAGREQIDSSIRSLYAELDAAVTERGPVCNASGRCCRFEAFGHRLYVTGLEIAWFMQGVGSSESSATQAEVTDQSLSLQQLDSSLKPQTPSLLPNCPYQIGGLCSTHAIRPLGCRVFFCEQGTEDWQQDTTELFLDRLKQLHIDHGLPYAYMEWRTGLAEAGLALGNQEPE